MKNPLKNGPQLKLPDRRPDLKVPGFVSDVYRDLRERHLLPLVGFLIVAIAAVPFVLGGSDENEEPAAPAPPGASSSAAKNASQVVVASSEGLRNYKERLGHRQPSNPFEQQYTDSEEEGSGGEGATLEESVGSGPVEESPETPSSGSGGGTSTSGTTSTGLQYFTYTIDVRIVPVSTNGNPSEAEPFVRRNLEKLTMLPAKKTPALTYIQISVDEEKALMLVNSNVKALFGDAVCVAGGETCQLLALEKGVPETVVYGGNERVFRIELLKVNVVETDPPKSAPKPAEGDG